MSRDVCSLADVVRDLREQRQEKARPEIGIFRAAVSKQVPPRALQRFFVGTVTGDVTIAWLN